MAVHSHRINGPSHGTSNIWWVPFTFLSIDVFLMDYKTVVRSTCVTSRNTLKTLLTKLRNVPYPSRGSRALPETSQDFPRLPEQFPKASLQFPRPSLTSLQLPKNPKTREHENPRTRSDLTRALHMDNLTRA